MNKQITIEVVDLIGRSQCISVDDGQKVFDKIVEFLKEGRNVIISFNQVDMLFSIFLNVAIGQLYGSFSEKTIQTLLKVKGLSSDDIELLNHVVNNAKKYYSNKKSYDDAWLEDANNEQYLNY